MGNKSRNTAIVVFILLGVFVILLSCSDSKEPQAQEGNHQKFKVKSDKPMPPFLCKANKDYTFKASGAIQAIYIDGKKHTNKNMSSWVGFITSFKKDTRIKIDFSLSSILGNGHIDIRQETKPDFPRFVYLTTNQYSDFSYSVKRGMDLAIERPGELYYAGYFKNGRLAKEELIKNTPNIHHFRFWNDSVIRFKAGEVPFILILAKQPQMVNLNVHHNSPEGYKTTNIGKAYFLKAGETVKTPFWADKGDTFQFNTNKIMVTSGNTWSKLYNRLFTVQTDGPIKLKAIEETAVDKIIIKRNRVWKLNLKHNESKLIVVNRGDHLMSRSKSRYYFNGQILNRDTTYAHPIKSDSAIEFKGSLDPKPIDVWVIQRRYY